MTAELIALAVVGVGYGLDRFGVLPQRRSTMYWRDRAESAEKAYVARDDEIIQLRQTRSLEPVIELVRDVAVQVAESARLNQETLGKLGAFNGTLRHIQEGMADTRSGLHDATEGLKLVTGLIAGALELPHQHHDPRPERPAA